MTRAVFCSLGLVCLIARADDVLHPQAPTLDRPTPTAIGIQMLISGDDNYNSTVTVQYKKTNDNNNNWIQGLPLFRVHPDTTLPYVIAPQFAGSILDLRPATTYDIQLTINDPDGYSKTVKLQGTTRALPHDPLAPNPRSVTDATSFSNALSNAQPGDVITLANGAYRGQFIFTASGTQDNPIVIRGASQDGVRIDGTACSSCSIVEPAGSWVHIENLTIQNGFRAIRFSGVGTIGNVVRHVHTSNTTRAIASAPNQVDYYISDNILEGRINWPFIYPNDNGKHSDDDGIHVEGNGHVVAHNRISGFGDAMKTAQVGARAVDFYGNDILWTYDNGIELDGSEGNARCMRNRFTNTYQTISGQPIYGGPAYIYRNVGANTVSEQFKLHSEGGKYFPNGVFMYNNTFVSANHALLIDTATPVHHFALVNNLMIGPASPDANYTVNWNPLIDDGLFDYNAYWPEKVGTYIFTYYLPPPPGVYLIAYSLDQVKRAGLELHSLILSDSATSPNTTPTLASGLIGPVSYKKQLAPQDFTLAPGSLALDAGTIVPNITDGYQGSAPDIGAIETGCPAPFYGPRPAGMDETNQTFGCITR